MLKGLTYIVLLRGVNVGGRNSVKMESLRTLFVGLGFTDVKTYVQSGNVVFRGKPTSLAVLVKRIEVEFLRVFGFSVPVVVRTAEQWAKVLKTNPFLGERDIDLSKLHVTFLTGKPSKSGLSRLEGVPAKSDRFRTLGEEIYLCCPQGYGRTKLNNTALERILELVATTRNWTSITKIYELTQD